MGAVKQRYHEQICEQPPDDHPEPSDLEMLQIDMEQSIERYLNALRKHYEKAQSWRQS